MREPTVLAPVRPEMLRWARERAGLDLNDLTAKFAKLPDWEEGTAHPTLKQAEDFARKVYVPFGYLFFAEPPDETLPIQDFRTFSGEGIMRPTPNLVDTIHDCVQRQDWYRDYARAEDMEPLSFVGGASIDLPPQRVAASMREVLRFDLNERKGCSGMSDALSLFRRKADEAGILVMVNGIVGSNTKCALDPAEFRGFAMCDPLAPLVFVNGRDAKAAQMFTLAHEIAHLWLGASALSNLGERPDVRFREEEVWCNAVAAEFLLPTEALLSELRPGKPPQSDLGRLARVFKVSSLVILRRLLDAEVLAQKDFSLAWEGESERLRRLSRKKSPGGGDFYRSTVARVGRRFARAIITSTINGKTLYRDAFHLLGIKKSETLSRLGSELAILK